MTLEGQKCLRAEMAATYAVIAQAGVIPAPELALIDMHERQIPQLLTFGEYTAIMNQFGPLIEAARASGHPHARALVWAVARRLVEYVTPPSDPNGEECSPQGIVL